MAKTDAKFQTGYESIGDSWQWWVEVGLPVTKNGQVEPLYCCPDIRIGKSHFISPTASLGEVRDDGRRWFRISGRARSEQEAKEKAERLSDRLQRLFSTLYLQQAIVFALLSDWVEIGQVIKIRTRLEAACEHHLPWKVSIEVGIPNEGLGDVGPEWENRGDGRVWRRLEICSRTANWAAAVANMFVERVVEALGEYWYKAPTSPDDLSRIWEIVLREKEELSEYPPLYQPGLVWIDA